ncbi:MAG: HAMP domain-containing protein, partial [Firmicutes bacterium]|nr:HAMP domain-containing protein [Bacillota bacterium]
MKRLSIKQKIILWFSVTLLLIITIISGLTFAIANLVLDDNIKERLMSVVTTNVQEIEFSVIYDREEIEQGDQFLSYKNGWLEIDDDFCDYFEGICTALYDENGNLLYGEAPLKLSDAEPLAYASMSSLRINGEKFYIYDKPLTGDFEGLWLRGVVSHNETLNVLYNVLRLSFWILPLLAVLSLLGGYVITRRSFMPVQQIAETASRIQEGGDLSQRLDIGEGKDEIHMLADTFNGMFERLEKSFESERQFTSDASHELRTPVAVIMAQSQYALELADSEEEYRESLEVIQRQSQRMNDIINQLLFFTRLDQGTEP